MTQDRIGLGVLGCGAFGQFALSYITQLSTVELVGIGATDPDAARRVTAQYDVPDYKSAENLVNQSDVELVYIATPPFLHHEQSIMALEAGKHVLCEKPMALSLEQAREMRDIAGQRDLIMVANLVQRYNPLYMPVKNVIDEGLLGSPLHAYFENYAKDEYLPPEHWFWDPQKSGGIFVEHGVHFFDMFRGWLGEGQVESAEGIRRPGGGQEEQVQCTVRHSAGVLVNFYHGFHQPARLDRQEIRLVFERGDIKLQGWIPIQASINGIVDLSTKNRLQGLFPHASCRVVETYGGEERVCRGRHKRIEVDERIVLDTPRAPDKEELYGRMLKKLMADQIEWIRDREHSRMITSENGIKSLEMALRANRLAHT